MIRVAVVGDIRLYRDGVASYLARHDGFSVVGTGESRDEALRLADEHGPDIMLLDMAMPASLQTVRDLAEQQLAVRVVALTVPEVEQTVLACVEAGVAGYVSRDGTLDDLVNVARSAARGETLCSPTMARRVWQRLAQLARLREQDPPRAELTAREREILQFIDHGLSNKQIAARLCIELATVKNHVHNILEKLQVRRRGEAVAVMRRRFGDPPPASQSGFSREIAGR